VSIRQRFRCRSTWVAALWVAAPVLAIAAPAPAPRPDGEVLRVLVVPDGTRSEFVSAEPKAVNPGFERELLEGFAKSRKRHVEVTGAKSWDDLVPALEEGRGDLIAGHFTRTADREQHMTFTDGILPTRTVVITRKPRPAVITLEELRKVKIGAVKASASLESLQDAGVPPAHITEGTQEEMVDLLRSGKVDAIARAAPLAILNQREDPALQLGVFVGPPSQFAWGVRKSDTALRDALNEHLQLARRTGAWNRLVVKYFGQAAIEILKQAESR